MELDLVRPNAHSLLPVLVQVHEHLRTAPSSQHALPGNLSPSSYLNLLLDQVRLWHLETAEIAMVVRVLNVYRHRFSAGWQGVGRAADMYRLGVWSRQVMA